MAKKAYRIKIASGAAREAVEAIDYYGDIEVKLGTRLRAELKSALKAIKSNPVAFQIRYDSVRLYHLPVFPYSIHFEVFEDEKLVHILAILHQHREQPK